MGGICSIMPKFLYFKKRKATPEIPTVIGTDKNTQTSKEEFKQQKDIAKKLNSLETISGTESIGPPTTDAFKTNNRSSYDKTDGGPKKKNPSTSPNGSITQQGSTSAAKENKEWKNSVQAITTPTMPQKTAKRSSAESRASSHGARPSIDSNAFTKFQIECLERHNELRALHGCPPLELSTEMCRLAKEWAKNLACCNKLEHSPNQSYGENLYMALGIDIDGKIPVQRWHDEIKDYNFAKGAFSCDTGHFTQVVWKNSQKLGVAREKKGKTTWVVAYYDPAGNYDGEYAGNVPPICKKNDVPCDYNQTLPKLTVEDEFTEFEVTSMEAPIKLPPTHAITDNSSDQFSEFELAGLAAHNNLRALHGAPPLKLNRELCDVSKEWAKHMASKDALEHRRNAIFGENIYMSYGKTLTPNAAVDSWYSEIKDYKFSHGGFGMDTGHFTQLVWKDTKELGYAFETK